MPRRELYVKRMWDPDTGIVLERDERVVTVVVPPLNVSTAVYVVIEREILPALYPRDTEDGVRL